MSAGWKKAAFIGFALLVFSGLPGGFSEARDVNIKQLMGENFVHLQKILIDLIAADYATVPHGVEVIGIHAVELINNALKVADGNRDLYLSFAYGLRSHADHLKTVVEALLENEKTQVEPGRLNIDYLRITAATHYGQMITTCVACHNQFRRRSLTK